MSHPTRIRVELRKDNPYSSPEDRDRAFRSMHAAFKRLVNENGIITEWKQAQYYESRGEKTRRKKREAELLRKKDEKYLKGRLREHFGN